MEPVPGVETAAGQRGVIEPGSCPVLLRSLKASLLNMAGDWIPAACERCTVLNPAGISKAPTVEVNGAPGCCRLGIRLHAMGRRFHRSSWRAVPSCSWQHEQLHDQICADPALRYLCPWDAVGL